MDNTIFQDQQMLENEKIKLIPLEHHHSNALFEANHPEIWSFMLSEISTLDEMEQWVASAIQLREQEIALPFVVVLKEKNQIIGSTRLFDINLNQKSCELGSTWYRKYYQKSFVNSNCKYLILQYCFEELEMVRVQFKTDERNKRSQRAIERLGAVKEGVMRNERILPGGFVRNAVLYSIINKDWNSIKKGFAYRDSKYQ
ncbi:GNAT family N-acetyltransferase [Peribacillus frigoritolerans]|uniref:GNAT family N-acetyltransferase n=1 Tax=Peribacillus frigoritolerans TaxID=450367 RepID=UPI00256FFCEB|nr:GNAT family N-acetyltransferase [Peribacillus frigoritolerans]